MRVLAALLALAALAVPAAAAPASTYVYFQTAPEFQYQSDQDVEVRFQAQYVEGNAPQQDLVRCEVRDKARLPFDVENGRDLAAGLRPAPAVHRIDFGRLEPGLYELQLTCTAGGKSKTAGLDLNVVLPPVPYAATLEHGPGRDGRFFFTPRDPDPSRVYTLTVYVEEAGGRRVLDEIHEWNATDIRVPYVRGQAVKVDVQDPNRWVNHENIFEGQRGVPWIWDPDFERSVNAQDQSIARAWTAGGLAAVAAGLLLAYAIMRRPRT